MSSSLEQPGGNNEPTWGEGGTGEGSMKQHFHKEQLEGASDHASEKGAPNSLELGHEGKMSQSGAAGGQQSAATSNLSEAQTAEPEMTESVKRAGRERAPSPVPSVISMRSEGSMGQPLNFKGEDKGSGDLTERPVSPMSSVSMCDSDKSNRPNFAQEGTRVFLAAGGVQCDVCHNPAVKACLTCRDSYCQTCIRPHYCDQDLEKHQLQDLQHQDRCEQHNKKLKFYCGTDKSAICSRCFLSHNGHDIIDLDTVRDQTALQTQAKIEGVPPPGPIQVLSVQSNSVTLRWSPPEGASGAYKYRVSWRRGQDSRSIEVVGLEVEVGGLLPGEKYHFSVATLGKDGQRSTCVESSVQTEVPVPKDLTVTPGSTCVSVAWAKPDGLKEPKSISADSCSTDIRGLRPGTEYSVTFCTELQQGGRSKPASVQMKTGLPPPGPIQFLSVQSNSVTLRWSPPEGAPGAYRYRVTWRRDQEKHSTEAVEPEVEVEGLLPGEQYHFSVITLGEDGHSSTCVESSAQTGKQLESARIYIKRDLVFEKDRDLTITELTKQCKVKPGSPSCYLLLTEETPIKQDSGVRIFGKRDDGKPTKTILLLGETGAGKTTLINTMVNFMLGVKWEDRVWFQIPEEEGKSQIHSQTSVITVNELETRSLCLRIIDTPGYVATEGVGFDKQITEDLQTLLQCEDDVHEIDVVVLVIKASQNRLTTFQRNIFKAILSVLGDANMVVFVTHSDGLSVPNIITTLKEANVPCAKDSNGNPLHFRFNNRQHESYEKQHDDLNHIFWNLSNESMNSFFSILEFNTSKDVPRKRRRLVNRLNNLKNAMKMSELKQKELQQIQEALEKKEKTFKVDEPFKVKKPINLPWWHLSKGAMCCTKCEENCHYPNCWLVKDLSMCSAIQNGQCTVCTNKCSVSDHVKRNFFYDVETREVTKNAVDYSLCDIKKELSNRVAETRKLFDEAEQCIVALNSKILKTEAFSKIDMKFFDFHMK